MGSESLPADIRIGVDIGGTFTDFVVLHQSTGHLETFKLPSTPHNPAAAVLEGLDHIYKQLAQQPDSSIDLTHGSTVATNALLERKGAATALLTTKGFKDVLQIGRQNRPSLYDLKADRAPVLVPEEYRFEITERVDKTGQVLNPLDEAGLLPIIDFLKSTQIESVAICFLFSFLNPLNEQLCAEKLREAGYFVSVSSEILPEYREYERTSTTVVNAYVTPVLSRYLRQLQQLLNPRSGESANHSVHLRVMQSNGGIISVNEAQRSGARCILSGPAGGIVGAQLVARQELYRPKTTGQQLPETNNLSTAENETSELRLITFDMGGTSTDVSIIDKVPQITNELEIAGCPIRFPLLDIHTIGAGGGSIARVDIGGALRVGPESAGADPGPACYGRTADGESLPTVTDANLFLGRMSEDHFLGGQILLDRSRSISAISRLASQIGLSAQETASGILDVVNAHMERALRVISIERGYDPRQFTLVSFGGAGGLHAAELANRLEIKRILIPRMASTLSAYGMLAADVVKDYSQTVMLPGEAPDDLLNSHFDALSSRAIVEMRQEGITREFVSLERQIDARYTGQSYELTIPFTDSYSELFHAAHRRMYGFDRLDSPIELVTLRLRATGHVEKPQLPQQKAHGSGSDKALVFNRLVYLQNEWQDLPFYDMSRLLAGDEVEGPAVILGVDMTVLVCGGFLVRFGMFGDILMVNGYAN